MSNKKTLKINSDSLISYKSKNKKINSENNLRKSKIGVQEYIKASQSKSTRRAYASDLRHFLAHGGSLPCKPKRLAKYLAESADSGLAVATLERRVTAIHRAHIDQHHASPARAEIVRQVLQGIRRTVGTKQRQAKPLLKDDVEAALKAIKINCSPVRAARDSALILIGFASAMRRSELVGMCVEHLYFSAEGVTIELPVSKTDQERRGRMVFIPQANGCHCPVKALADWLEIAGIRTGHVFRSVNRYNGIAKFGLTAQSVALIVKAAVAQLGEETLNVSGHSLRAGYCTSAVEGGMQLWQIREQTGHKSNVTLLKYIRRAGQKSAPSLL